MECCVGIIILTVITVGGILIYAQFATAIADRERIAWARTLDNITLPELEKMRDELENQKKALQRDLLLLSGHKRDSLYGKLGEASLRIKILEGYIEEQSSKTPEIY